MFVRPFRLLAPALLLAAIPAVAQQTPVSNAGMGTVTGHVTCADTGRPARFAMVALFAVPKTVTASSDPSAKPEEAVAAALKSLGDTNMTQTQTGLDGAFTANNVAPGDYYAFASVPGYVQPTNMVEAAVLAGADLSKPLAGVPVVHVSADRSSNVEVAAQRGAAVSGKVLWDDGSPVARAVVQVIPPTGNQQQLPQQFAMLSMVSVMGGGLMFITDDRGAFRVSGLAPGEYDLKASVSTNTQFGMGASGSGLGNLGAVTPLVVYAPHSVHRSDAKPVSLKAGEELGDQQITFGLRSMRMVSGRVTALEDHHGINSATVRLVDTADKDFKRSAGVDAQGNYTVDFVPPGTYTLTVEDAEDTRPPAKKGKGMFGSQPETVRSYADGKSSVLVGDTDITGKNMELGVDKTGGSKKPDLAELLKDVSPQD